MKTHADIIADADTIRELTRLFPGTSVHTIRSWKQRDSIPGDYWGEIAAAGLADLGDLVSAATARRQATQPHAVTRTRNGNGTQPYQPENNA